jgi:lysyl-tRNA synthetase class 2
MADPISSYEQERRLKRDKVRELGLDPYGQAGKGVTPLAGIRSSFRPEMGHDGGPMVKAAGRVVLKRDMGKLSFLTLRDDSGDLQVALDKRRLDETSVELRGLIDLGDLVVVEGKLGSTNKGETTVWATSVTMAAKALLPPPAKWQGLADIELRYRQRYVDLWANPEVMRLQKLRIRIVDEVRRFMQNRGFVEVETPMMQPLAGGAAARPFVTHHNALDIPLYLRIAPELYLKRLLVGGFSKVFEVNRNFRNEGISPRHNPEFTMLEAYEAFGSWETMADLVEAMICHLAITVEGLPKAQNSHGADVSHEHIATRAYDLFRSGIPGSQEQHWERARRDLSLKIEHRDAGGTVTRTINLRRPWRRVRMTDLVHERTGWAFDKQRASGPVRDKLLDELTMRKLGVAAAVSSPADAKKFKFARDEIARHFDTFTPAEQLQEVYEKLIEPTLIDPTFVTHVPSVIIPLARESREDPYFADVYELAINGQEISPGYSELNDPDVQARHFAHQVGDSDEQQKVDEDFLAALRYGMPPAGGMGLGIDRLVMMLTGAESIRDVILFPLMKPVAEASGDPPPPPAGAAAAAANVVGATKTARKDEK